MVNYFVQNAGPILFYGAVVTLSAVLALASGRSALVWLSGLLFTDWLVWNISLGAWDFARAPMLLPMVDALFCGFTTWLALKTNDATARLVAYLYLPAIFAWLVFILTKTQDSFACYLSANMLFLAQVVVAGASGARLAWIARVAGRHRPGDLLPHRGLSAARVHGLGGSAKADK